jgi:hypothetical protein
MAVMQSRADREAKNPHWILARIMYSPDLNPIEMPYSKFKAHMRKLAERTSEGVRRAIRSFLPSLGGENAPNYFRRAGYASIWPEPTLAAKVTTSASPGATIKREGAPGEIEKSL